MFNTKSKIVKKDGVRVFGLIFRRVSQLTSSWKSESAFSSLK